MERKKVSGRSNIRENSQCPSTLILNIHGLAVVSRIIQKQTDETQWRILAIILRCALQHPALDQHIEGIIERLFQASE